MNIKNLLENNVFVKGDRKANEITAWKDLFYKAYKEKNYDLATRLYLDKFKPFTAKIPDVHAGYRDQVQKEKQVTLYIAVFIIVFMIVVYLVVK